MGGYLCRIWYRGQPLVCNLCSVQGHKSANCPNRDKCRRCGQSGHFARECPNPWGNSVAPPPDVSSVPLSATDFPPLPGTSGTQGTPAVAASASGPQRMERDAPPSTSSASLPDGSIAEKQNLASHSAGTSDSTPSSSNEEQTGDGASPSPPVVDSLSESVSSDSLDSCSILPAPTPTEAPPSSDSQDVGADDYAFTCGQAMPDSLSSQVIDTPVNDGPVGHNVVVVEGGQASDPSVSLSLGEDSPSDVVILEECQASDPPTSVSSRGASPSDVVKDTLRRVRLGGIFKKPAPVPKKGVSHSLPPVTSDRPRRRSKH